jgi:hypothetical protein
MACTAAVKSVVFAWPNFAQATIDSIESNGCNTALRHEMTVTAEPTGPMQLIIAQTFILFTGQLGFQYSRIILQDLHMFLANGSVRSAAMPVRLPNQ